MTGKDVVSALLGIRTAAVIRAAVELQVFDRLGDEALDADALAARIEADPRGTRVLLNALAAVGVLDTDGARFSIPAELAGPLIAGRDNWQYIGTAVKLATPYSEWEALGRLAEAVRHGGTVMGYNLETPGNEFLEEWAANAYMGSDTAALAELVWERLTTWAQTRSELDVLDVACGPGWYGLTVAANNPRARVSLVDFPNIVAYAEKHARELAVQDRVRLLPGDMFTDPLAGPYDVAIAAGVMHHFSSERVRELLRRLHSVLKPGGRLVIVAPVADEADPAADPRAHLFSTVMLALTTEGQVHSYDSYHAMLADSGFAAPEIHSKDGSSMRLLIATRAERLASLE
ncbi:class I SAM-dependent methyltransferase [Crossiella sp. CA-258035]|uniref:class I SAM-dependent methyltransferase n=1 Tax=Crossiella sp. CA-258035 TaxID=2981138 RepID=UPI0024BC10F5|nr:class I SAM-dependent methyltransferase [Crossiella sp. CA-258035]WHT23346.1 class I SAM-dependent methyltransferase [Crossiella sp. CA-258035]